jgi:dipeptidyl aminopeptidase/acylaminoacyl peptidase
MMIRNGRFSCSYLFFVLVAMAAAFAADQHRLELKDIPDLVGASELVQASDVAISTDGEWVAYTVTSTKLITRETRQRLFVQPFDGGEAIQIGPQDADNSSPSWSPDGHKLLFFSTSSGHSSLALWSVAEKTTRVLDVAVLPWPAPEWLPDGAQILVALAPHEGSAAASADPKTPAPIVFTASDTAHPLQDGHYIGVFSTKKSTDSFDFAVVDAATGKARTVAANIDPNFHDYQISPDGKKLAYSVNKGEFDYDANERVLHDINVVDLQSGSTSLVASDLLGSGFGFSAVWSHNNKMLAVIGGTMQDDTSSPPFGSSFFRPGHCYVIDTQRPSVVRPIGPRSLSRFAHPTWNDDDSSIYAVTLPDQVGVPQKIIKLNLATGAAQTVASLPAPYDISIIDGQSPRRNEIYVTGYSYGGETGQLFAFNLRSERFIPVAQGNYAIGSLSASGAGTHFAYVAVDSTDPGNVWISERGTGKARQLTHFDLSQAQREKIGERKSVSWEVNGRTLYGTIWLPTNYREGQRFPTIVEVYPGDQGSGMKHYFDGDPLAGDFSWQAFSANGYAVFWPDFPLRIGDGPHEIAAQILPGIDKIVAMGIADPNALGVYGRSWGGYSTFALIAQTRRFKAAIAASGYSNLFTGYGQLDDNSSPYVLGLLENDMVGVSPWQDRDLYIKNSPYFNFDKVTTPVLIQYGGEDRPFAWTSREAFVALRRLEKTVTLLGYPNEGHSVHKPENQIDFTNRALDWFDQYLKPRSTSAGAN